ncbi:XRE family transcriptional regulator [Mesorhizobium sp. M7A.F.Ca.CA.001.07.2.1]|uniref:helix-turn-helix domain-containing protein n=2 Tax=Phyllobacteriaceae TaxID=69277 RepID=UPI000FCC1F1E|nr:MULTISPECIES: helix-turn-helix transcriptional regulator [Mesorhizobium]RVB35296.1 XRE family transcriptional regulator [Mesorhizobium sp. M7A.F.Ca.CA.004.05.1.1]MCF6122090.1 helix-turn-helix domain-containing protein [Mesorhizobium ciceri]MCQ8812671.1 helix-turn-helix domain-containing protein [Mesorhizobium sp. SEMIA396]RUX70364.1 XRE family transcriptional regulator [Mesorhizobium sp. M7A.F.Ca.CA.004.08.2.1]RUX85305.1 XRE family transcriptional regulator [Mesorhizobium sp. M7A.F.Ca.CA.00
MNNTIERKTELKASLGQYLASIREDRGMKLREVETATKREVSNAYLSQIENGKIKKPSPNVLHVLAQVYRINYEQLMQMAGYAVTSKTSAHKPARNSFTELNLSPEEDVKLLEYLRFLRSSK